MPHLEQTFSSLMKITHRPDLIFVRGEGSWLWDDEGNKYLDFIQGWAVNCLGHAHPALVQAIQKQAEQLIHCSPGFYNNRMIELADLVVRHSKLDQVFFANCGAEANEGAIKLARKWGKLHKNGAYEILTFENSFHGRTLATMSASGKPQWKDLFEPKVPGFIKLPLNDLQAVQSAISEKTVAILLEPIQGEGGVIPATEEFLHALRKLTQERNILLIFDEIQTGMGRTGKLFGFEHTGILPDILTLGKGLGGGVPLAALVCKKEIFCFEPGDQGGTFNGNPLMAAAGCAVFGELTAPGFLEAVVQRGEYLKSSLEQFSLKHQLGEVRGKGMLLALDFQKELTPKIVEKALQARLLLNAPRPNLLRFMPALTVSYGEIDQMMQILERVMEEI